MVTTTPPPPGGGGHDDRIKTTPLRGMIKSGQNQPLSHSGANGQFRVKKRDLGQKIKSPQTSQIFKLLLEWLVLGLVEEFTAHSDHWETLRRPELLYRK